MDLIEETARIHGYNNLPRHAPKAALHVGKVSAAPNLSVIRAVLVESAYQEAITYSFVDAALQESLEPDLPVRFIFAPTARFRECRWK